MIQRLLLLAIGIGALVLNPSFGCGQDAPTFRYGPDEMRAAVEGTWKLSVPATATKPAVEIVFSLSQSAKAVEQHSRAQGLVSDAVACSTRTLVKSASACGDQSSMPLDVVLTAGTGDATGRFHVFGVVFKSGVLELDVGTSDVYARVAPNGTMTNVTLDGVDGTMVRVSTAQR